MNNDKVIEENKGENMNGAKAMTKAFDILCEAQRAEVLAPVSKWMFGEFEMSPEVEKVVEKHFRKIRRRTKWIFKKYRILIRLAVWRANLRARWRDAM